MPERTANTTTSAPKLTGGRVVESETRLSSSFYVGSDLRYHDTYHAFFMLSQENTKFRKKASTAHRWSETVHRLLIGFFV